MPTCAQCSLDKPAADFSATQAARLRTGFDARCNKCVMGPSVNLPAEVKGLKIACRRCGQELDPESYAPSDVRAMVKTGKTYGTADKTYKWRAVCSACVPGARKEAEEKDRWRELSEKADHPVRKLLATAVTQKFSAAHPLRPQMATATFVLPHADMGEADAEMRFHEAGTVWLVVHYTASHALRGDTWQGVWNASADQKTVTVTLIHTPEGWMEMDPSKLTLPFSATFPVSDDGKIQCLPHPQLPSPCDGSLKPQHPNHVLFASLPLLRSTAVPFDPKTTAGRFRPQRRHAEAFGARWFETHHCYTFRPSGKFDAFFENNQGRDSSPPIQHIAGVYTVAPDGKSVTVTTAWEAKFGFGKTTVETYEIDRETGQVRCLGDEFNKNREYFGGKYTYSTEWLAEEPSGETPRAGA